MVMLLLRDIQTVTLLAALLSALGCSFALSRQRRRLQGACCRKICCAVDCSSRITSQESRSTANADEACESGTCIGGLQQRLWG